MEINEVTEKKVNRDSYLPTATTLKRKRDYTV